MDDREAYARRWARQPVSNHGKLHPNPDKFQTPRSIAVLRKSGACVAERLRIRPSARRTDWRGRFCCHFTYFEARPMPGLKQLQGSRLM
jgi:hypothetical protein